MDGITFQAIFHRATTTIDGGWNVTFSVSQEEALKVTQLAQLRETVFQVACVPVDAINNPFNEGLLE